MSQRITKETVCSVCKGTGFDSHKSITYEEENHTHVGFYCTCWYGWLLKQRNTDDSETEEISLLEVEDPWGMQSDGKYRRKVTSFFELIGIKFRGNREIPFWSQPILKEIDPGLVVIIKTKSGEILLQTKVEPGNSKKKSHTLLAATIQASASNLKQAHGGKKPPLAKYESGINNVESKDDIPNLEENMRWFTATEINEAFRKGDLNTHLVQVLYANSQLS